MTEDNSPSDSETPSESTDDGADPSVPDASPGDSSDSWDEKTIETDPPLQEEDELGPMPEDSPSRDGASGTSSNTEPDLDTQKKLTNDLGLLSENAKWFTIGVGGTGGNLVDSLLLRYETEKEEGSHWEGALRGIAYIDTREGSVIDSYWATESGLSIGDPLEYVIPPGDGAGTNDEMGEKFAEDYFSSGNPIDYFDAINIDGLQDASAILYLHSVVNGTGSGAAPTIAREINDAAFTAQNVSAQQHKNPVYSGVVLPSKAESAEGGGMIKKNAAVGLARMAEQTNAIIPFENDYLVNAAVSTKIKRGDQYFPTYKRDNETLIGYLEAFTSVAGGAKGEDFDVSDPINPLSPFNPLGLPPSKQMADVLAPAYGELSTSSFNHEKLRRLLGHTFGRDGRLVDFDLETAWGGQFLFLCPPGTRDNVRDTVRDESESLSDILAEDSWMAVGEDEEFIIDYHFVMVPELENYRLWAAIWNPELPALQRIYDYANERIEDGGFYSDRINEHSEIIKNLFDKMGRDALK